MKFIDRVAHVRSHWRGLQLPGMVRRQVHVMRTLARWTASFPPMRRAITTCMQLFRRGLAVAGPQLDDWLITANLQPAYVPLRERPLPKSLPARLITFYLPQFHRIPENDAWWGDGFTEWTNVRRAQPQFVGHDQPHEPGELGYYDLLEPAVLRRQVELAKLYGIGGFCFYFYWFNGKRLLEKPLEHYLQERALDLPFCLCWANENWTRTWDGKECEVLIAQRHSAEDDLAFIRHVAGYLRDARYLRVDGKPLLLVYRPGVLPDPAATARRWRDWCRQTGIGEIFLAYTQSFERANPKTYGFDAAVEFPPNNPTQPLVAQEVTPLSADFAGTVYDWRSYLKASYDYPAPGYPLFRGVCPRWDNTPRRGGRGTVLINNTPQGYEKWLANAIAETRARISQPDQRLIFVNAWNEWAEGAYLEPDRRYGYAWLEATRNALLADAVGKLLVVSHDAHPHGAQFLALGMVRGLRRDLHLDVEVVLLGPGKLKPEFAALAPVHDLTGWHAGHPEMQRWAERLAQRGYRRAIVNSTVSGWIIPIFHAAGIESICLVHELPGLIRDYGLEPQAIQIAQDAHAVVFPSPVVAEGFARYATVNPAKIVIRPQGLYRRNRWRWRQPAARDQLRKRLQLLPDAKVVLAVGYGDRRKGADLFVECALSVLASRDDVEFVWVGHWESGIRQEIDTRLHDHPQRRHIHFVGFDADTALYHAASDVYALTSREDPFPNVVLESFDAGVPVVAFAGTGGAAHLLEDTGGIVVPALDCLAFAEAILRLLDVPETLKQLGLAGQQLLDSRFAFRPYLFDLCALLGIALPRVSVIVPNYNYANFLKERLNSIFDQSLPIYELIILDDASTDSSLRTITEWLSAAGIEAVLRVNSTNSGSVFGQWQHGVQMAGGGFVWIAEADDSCDADFLATVLPPLVARAAVLSYCDSRQINAKGRVMSPHYQKYLSVVSCERWRQPYVASGEEEIREALAVMNTIPNVSGVVFRREVLAEVFTRYSNEIAAFPRAGDWVTYFRILQHGSIAYSPRAANCHRRHRQGVIAGSARPDIVLEISRVQALISGSVDISEEISAKAAGYLAGLEK